MGTPLSHLRVAAACLLVLALFGCGPAIVPGGTAASPPAGVSGHANVSPRPREHDTSGGRSDRPPPVTVRYGERTVDLEAYTYCFGNLCADGSPDGDPPNVGSPDEVLVDFPLDGWSFEAFFEPAGNARCPRSQSVPLTPNGDGTFLLHPAGYAGAYDVTLFGRGDGDLVTVFGWSTPFDGPLARPESRLAVLAGNDGEVDSYGVELSLSNLASTPEVALATITVTAADGQSLTFDASRAGGCQPAGSVYWDGPDGKGLAAAELGPRPFTYQVELVLDGKRYAAVARWPADEIRGNEPSVGLEYSPPLPALG